MSIISYAQNHEDVLLDRLFPRVVGGFYIDVGAHHPTDNSVTRHFYDLGWHGVNVEPAATPFALLDAARPRDVNLNVALSDHPGIAEFHEFDGVYAGNSTLSSEIASAQKALGVVDTVRTVNVMTLAQVCEAYSPETIDFLNIDVEDHEAAVIAGGDWERFRPRVVLVEATRPLSVDAAAETPRLLAPAHEAWEPQLLAASYLYASFDGVNRWYVRAEDSHLAPSLQVPVNVCDGVIDHRVDVRIRELEGRQQAAQLATQTLRTEQDAALVEVALVHARLEALQQEHRQVQAELAVVAEALRALPTGATDTGPELGWTSIRIAQRLNSLSARYPSAAGVAQHALEALAHWNWSRRQPPP